MATEFKKIKHIHDTESNLQAQMEVNQWAYAEDQERINIYTDTSAFKNITIDDYQFLLSASNTQVVSASARFLQDTEFSGSVGIGTATPGAKLHAEDSGQVDVLFKSTGNASPLLSLDANPSGAGNNLGTLSFKWNSNEVARLYATGGDDATNKDEANLVFRTANGGVLANRLILHQEGHAEFTGDVGIGTATPGANLHAEDSGQVDVLFKSTGNASPLLSLDANPSGAGNNLGTLSFKWNSNEVARLYATGGDDATNKDEANLVLRTWNAGIGGDRVIVHQEGHAEFTGDVGIGTASPGAKLDVNGDAIISTSLTVGQDAVFNNDKGIHDFIVHGASVDEVFRVDTFGDVVRMAGDLRIANADPRIVLRDTDSGNNIAIRVLNGQLRFDDESAGQNWATFQTNGFFGIATPTPEAKLHVEGAMDAAQIIKNTGSSGAVLTLDANSGATGGNIGGITWKWNGTTVAHILARAGDDAVNKDEADVRIATANGGFLDDRFVLHQEGHAEFTGDVGIGTASPDTPIHIADGVGTIPAVSPGTVGLFQNNASSSDDAKIFVLAGATGVSVLALGDSSDQDVGQIAYFHADNYMRFRANGASKMYLDSTGLGLGGQVDAGFDLQIKGTGLFGLPKNTIAASSTDAQGEAPMTASINRITSVPDSSSSVTAPPAKFGAMFGVVNEGNFSVKMYPASSQEFREQDISVPTSKTIQVGQYFFYVCMEDGLWHEITGP